MKKIFFIVGTRPEAIKLAPLIKVFEEEKDSFSLRVCATGQHTNMVTDVFDFFGIEDFRLLDTMKPGQSLNSLFAVLVRSIEKELLEFNPDLVIVQGDTHSALSGALSGFYAGAKVAHVEAGLRTFDNRSPFPEEMNRKLIGQVADWHFAPTRRAKAHLIDEGIQVGNILLSGNTIIDALNIGLEKIEQETFSSVNVAKGKLSDPQKPFLLITLHRRENQGPPAERICKAIIQIANTVDIEIIIPVHPNKDISTTIRALLSNHPQIKLIDPVPYPGFLWLMKHCSLILTDSGGIQEEASVIGKNVILLRENTERAEAVTGGFVYKAGSDAEKIVNLTLGFLAKSRNPVKKEIFGKGDASRKIINFIRHQFAG